MKVEEFPNAKKCFLLLLLLSLEIIVLSLYAEPIAFLCSGFLVPFSVK